MATTFVKSPNYTPGRVDPTTRKTVKIDRIVIHWIVGNLASADAVFTKTSSQVSAHYGIENKTIHQYVKEADTAWHAGVYAMNLRSIGIEHSAAPGRPATATTIDSSAKLVAEICKKYKIPCDRAHIIKHSEVKATQCPGTIPIDTIIKKAKAILAGGTDEMLTKDQIYVLFRFYYGRDPGATEITKYVGKVTFEKLQDTMKSAAAYEDVVARSAAGTLDVKQHLPGRAREAYKSPTTEYEQITEPVFRKKVE